MTTIETIVELIHSGKHGITNDQLDKTFDWLKKLKFDIWIPEKINLTEPARLAIAILIIEGSVFDIEFNSDYTKIRRIELDGFKPMRAKRNNSSNYWIDDEVLTETVEYGEFTVQKIKFKKTPKNSK